MTYIAEILFDGGEVTRRYIAKNPDRFKSDVAILKGMTTDAQIEDWTVAQGARIVSSLGREVDRLEVDIKAHRPEVKHIDLEIL
jgi:hypothetical protein